VREGSTPEIRKAGLDAAGGIGVDLEIVTLRQWRGAALDRVLVLLEVHAPLLAGHEPALVVVQRSVGVHVEHRR
jgi:hypothetical protein